MPNRVIEVGFPEWDHRRVQPVKIGGAGPLAIIAGPCQIESYDHAMRHAESIARTCRTLDMPFVYKSSYDKANRTALDAPRGVGEVEGLRILEAVRRQIGVPVTTDVHSAEEAYTASMVVDLIQVPAMLFRQTDLLVACGKNAQSVNIKKGPGARAEDMGFALHKVVVSGCDSVLLTERGSTFGYGDLVVDMRNLLVMSKLAPVCFDATHSVQRRGDGASTMGDREHVPGLARAAVAAGVDAVFLEVHEDPDSAPSDGASMLRLEDLGPLLYSLIRLDDVRRRTWEA